MLYLRSWLHPRGTKVPIHHFKGKNTLFRCTMLSCCKPVQVPFIHPYLGEGCRTVREKVFNAKCIGFIKVVLKAICYA